MWLIVLMGFRGRWVQYAGFAVGMTIAYALVTPLTLQDWNRLRKRDIPKDVRRKVIERHTRLNGNYDASRDHIDHVYPFSKGGGHARQFTHNPYQREQEAIQAPTSTRNSAAASFSPTPVQPSSNDLSQVEALSRALGARQSGDAAVLPNAQPAENEYDAQNMQSRKEAFLAAGRNRQADDYLRSTREALLSRYEIKAG